MPRIAKRFLDCVVYIYPDEKSAASDKGFGGSGFVVARCVSGGYQTFVVTNRHVMKAQSTHRQAWISQNGFVTRDILEQHLGLGSDVATLGRFIGVNGLVTNTPIARFGSIATPNRIEVWNSFQSNQETFVVDCQSVPGYSGSPVIAFLSDDGTRRNRSRKRRIRTVVTRR